MAEDVRAEIVASVLEVVVNEGDQIVLACLKQNRARLSKACLKVLSDHGQ